MMAQRTKGKPTCCLKSTELAPRTVTSSSCQLVADDVIVKYRLRKAKTGAVLAQRHAKANVEVLTEEVEKVTLDIQNLKASISDVEHNIAKSLCKTRHPRKLAQLCKLKTSLRIDLSTAVELEASLKKRLQNARTMFRNAKLDDLLITEDMARLKEVDWLEHTLAQKDEMAKDRILRENQSTRNATKARDVTITSVASAITAHVLQLPDRFMTLKPVSDAKAAKQSLGKHISKTMRKLRETKAITVTENQLRHRRQEANLTKLKKDIRDIKETLAAKIQLKQNHDKEVALEKEEVKNLLLGKGTNPYLAEYLLAIEEKQREIQRKLLVEEQKRLLDMQREFAVVESSKAKEETDKKKWDTFWANKTKERLSNERRSKMEMYYDLPDLTEGDRPSSGVPESKSHDTEESGKSSEEHAFMEESEYHTPPQSAESRESHDESRETKLLAVESNIGSNEMRKSKGSARSSVRRSATPDKSEHGGALKKDGPSGSTTRASMREGGTPESPPGGGGSEKDKLFIVDETHPLSLRKAIQLDYVKKDALLLKKSSTESERIVLMNDTNVIDFGEALLGSSKYMLVNIANLSMDSVMPNMSVINPYGPYMFCNALKNIPPNNFYTLRFKYHPLAPGPTEEIVKITDKGNPKTPIVLKLKGLGMQSYGSSVHSDEHSDEWEL